MSIAANRASARAVRLALLASTAMLAVPAAAQDAGVVRPDGSYNDPQIVISQPGTPASAVDKTDVTGVGQMIIDQKNGFVGLCTGTLINPRTVIFAAHCVNESPSGAAMNPWGYGTGAGQLPIGFGFKANNLPGIVSWFNSNYQSSKTNAFYNVNQVVYNPDSLKLGLANNFLQGDIALASLDTPASNVPTWTILLSALPAPASISNTTGTGYHVTEVGYGNNGVGTTGSTGGIDYRRRVAENFIGLLGSLDDRDLFLFGSPDGLPQNLYQLDFDDPRRGTASASPYDFNLFKDNALPSEGITAPGDSGGPLILDKTFDRPTVIGVLSGGSRFYGAQPAGSYGTSSFYQPLYLFWDYIVANNPYRYVSAKAGDGKWSDATHWVTNLDPAYQIIAGGKLVNGVPTTPGAGIAGDGNKFGQVCFEQRGSSECQDVATGVYYVNGQPVSADAAAPDAAGATAGAIGVETASDKATVRGITAINSAQDATASSGLTASAGDVAAAAAAAAALPTPTLANGLPGATNFVPNNIDPNAATKTNGRYFDVNLSATGTTTLDTAVTIDRFTISGTGAKLNVTSTGSLSSLIDFSHLTGLVTVDGRIKSAGDYFMMAGALNGSGRIDAPYFTNATGMIAPGTIGGVGTLTFGGNVILSSGSALLIDLGDNGASDKLAVVATQFSGTTALDGKASIGGTVGFAPASGTILRANSVYTILTAQGGIGGTFAAPKAFSAILTPQFLYSTNAVQVRINAGLYANVVAGTPIQSAYARLLDSNRANATGLSELYGILDLQNAATIQTTLEGLAPRTESLVQALGTTATDNLARFYRDRLGQMDVRGGLGGSLALIGQPIQLAAVATMPGAQATASDSGGISLQENALPDTVAAYIAGGYIDGKARSTPGLNPQGSRDPFDGWFVAGGIETEIDDNAAIGFSLSYTKVDGTTSGIAQTARGELYSGTLYGKLETESGVTLDTQFSAGVFQARTRRGAQLVTNSYTLRSRDNALAVSSEVGLAKAFDLGGFKIGPRIAARASHLGFTPTAETGGAPALRYDRGSYDSLQGRAGLQLSGGMGFKPYASAYYVHDFQDKPGYYGANFAGGFPGNSALFALPGQDKNWGELSAGVSFGGEKVSVSVGADTTVGRESLENQSYRGSISVRF
ncbi:conserved exported hypothetical protein [Sphingomonas sp. EC-HK361]|uniref:autotransporter domain-containing protein n=1 Tax=Sphingomonas sp. EC-HK361 TaxID=2038397 RepID=UPI001251FAF5|nr:autotransporter domain-containing protein [Sphingomonas sp. EC-HK361]VVS97538.1 conserved exported hypothetical protein [Sphingomonas sp. EC-HK361]